MEPKDAITIIRNISHIPSQDIQKKKQKIYSSPYEYITFRKELVNTLKQMKVVLQEDTKKEEKGQIK